MRRKQYVVTFTDKGGEHTERYYEADYAYDRLQELSMQAGIEGLRGTRTKFRWDRLICYLAGLWTLVLGVWAICRGLAPINSADFIAIVAFAAAWCFTVLRLVRA